MTVYLHGVGHAHPKNEITNDFLERLDIGTSVEWILERTGIRSRRTVLGLDYIAKTRNADVRAASEAMVVSGADLVSEAVEMALARSGMTRADIGLILAGGTLPEYVTPAEAGWIGGRLGIEAPAVDVRSACTSVGAALYLLSLMAPDKIPDLVLVAACETVTRAVDYRDRSAAVLWGDAAVALLVSTRLPSRVRLEQASLSSSPAGWDKVVIPWASHFTQQGRTVQAFAIKRTVQMLRALRASLDHADAARFHFIGHQGNALMLENVCRTCQIPADRHHENVQDFGNTATAGSPSVLSQEWERFRPGDCVALLGVGAGLTWTGGLLRFGEGA